MDHSEHLSLGRIAKICHVSRTTVYRWIVNGRLPGYTLPSGHFRVRPEDLAEFRRAHGMSDDPQAVAPPASPGPRVLIADDHVDVLTVLRRVVERTLPDADIHASVNGVDTCIAAASLRPELILLDILMPGMDGFAVLQELLRRPELDGTRVIVVSAFEPFERVAALRRHHGHVVACHQKPIDLEALAASITEALASRVRDAV